MIWESCAPKELSSDSNCCEATAAGCWHSRVVAEIDPEAHSSTVHTQKMLPHFINSIFEAEMKSHVAHT